MELTKTQRRVMEALLSLASGDARVKYPPVRELMRLLGLNSTQVNNTIDVLEKKEWLEAEWNRKGFPDAILILNKNLPPAEFIQTSKLAPASTSPKRIAKKRTIGVCLKCGETTKIDKQSICWLCSKTGICVQCSKEKPLPYRGLCSACYQRKREHNKNPDIKARIARTAGICVKCQKNSRLDALGICKVCGRIGKCQKCGQEKSLNLKKPALCSSCYLAYYNWLNNKGTLTQQLIRLSVHFPCGHEKQIVVRMCCSACRKSRKNIVVVSS